MIRCFTYSKLLKVHQQLKVTRSVILGIETSCDDTGAAVFDLQGKLLGEALSTQKSSRFGGVIPTIAMYLHKEKIETVVSEALKEANKSIEEVTAIAVTNRPGLKGPLIIGTDYAKYLCLKYNKPMIPVHHMVAHALTVRMEEDVKFPFMILLISGGHCILGIAKDIDDFCILGSSINDSPGEALDKIARYLQIHNLPGMRDLSGGQAVEILAKDGDPSKFPLGIPLLDERSCRFSFSGFKGHTNNILAYRKEEIPPSKEELSDYCAGAQFSITKHLCQRLQRGIEYSTAKDLMPENGTLVVSGGVASNQFVRSCLSEVCGTYGWKSVFPRPKLCTDNGVMIGWTGYELWRRGMDIIQPDQVLDVELYPKCPLGEDITQDVIDAHIKCKWIKLSIEKR